MSPSDTPTSKDQQQQPKVPQPAPAAPQADKTPQQQIQPVTVAPPNPPNPATVQPVSAVPATAKQLKNLYLDVSKKIQNGEFKNSKINESIQEQATQVVNSYYIMQGHLAVCFAYFGSKILGRRRILGPLPEAILLGVFTLSTGYSGHVYNKTNTAIQQSLESWEGSKFKSIKIVEYQENAEQYLNTLLEE